MPTPEWVGRCELVRGADFDVGVNVWDSVYVGPENDVSAKQ